MILLIIFGIILYIGVLFCVLWCPYWADDSGLSYMKVVKNDEINWFLNSFFPPHTAVYYELRESINGLGLAILIILLTLITLPNSALMFVIGIITLAIRKGWKIFCKIFARKK